MIHSVAGRQVHPVPVSAGTGGSHLSLLRGILSIRACVLGTTAAIYVATVILSVSALIGPQRLSLTLRTTVGETCIAWPLPGGNLWDVGMRPGNRVLVLDGHAPAGAAGSWSGQHLAVRLSNGRLLSASATTAIAAISAVHRGEQVVDPDIAHNRVDAAHPSDDCTTRDLSTRELEVLSLIRDGASNKEVAQALEIGVRTVESYLRPGRCVPLSLGDRGWFWHGREREPAVPRATCHAALAGLGASVDAYMPLMVMCSPRRQRLHRTHAR
jgi:hypothetical protein